MAAIDPVVPPNEKIGHDGFHVEDAERSSSSDRTKQDAGFAHDDALTYFTPDEQRKIIHRIDRRLVTTVGIMYCISLMDRTNLSAANIAGMEADLGLDQGTRYVSLLERDSMTIQLLEMMALTLSIVDHHACVLHDVYCLSTSSDGVHAQDRSSYLLGRADHLLGLRNDWHGLR